MKPNEIPELRSSLLDMLHDEDNGAHYFDPYERYKKMVCRDIESLLNTKLDWTPLIDSLQELKLSSVNYGLEDFSTKNLTYPGDKDMLCIEIRELIEQYEPRLERVKVKILENSDPVDRVVRLMITANLIIEQDRERLSFSTKLNPVDHLFSVKELDNEG
ncbi:type VI secretion system baseplate subunit TssE [Kangiella shandongensis]|uniref:type VI secretion system baseplate subunit TssE n=1 Tax=Kangiella shandongensis TaxID=2763258 RepID=UPI001CBFA363|nr:type VI secretion system baseplate subunit TssE [Kangiella shandongensis]